MNTRAAVRCVLPTDRDCRDYKNSQQKGHKKSATYHTSRSPSTQKEKKKLLHKSSSPGLSPPRNPLSFSCTNTRRQHAKPPPTLALSLSPCSPSLPATHPWVEPRRVRRTEIGHDGHERDVLAGSTQDRDRTGPTPADIDIAKSERGAAQRSPEPTGSTGGEQWGAAGGVEKLSAVSRSRGRKTVQ